MFLFQNYVRSIEKLMIIIEPTQACSIFVSVYNILCTLMERISTKFVQPLNTIVSF